MGAGPLQRFPRAAWDELVRGVGGLAEGFGRVSYAAFEGAGCGCCYGGVGDDAAVGYLRQAEGCGVVGGGEEVGCCGRWGEWCGGVFLLVEACEAGLDGGDFGDAEVGDLGPGAAVGAVDFCVDCFSPWFEVLADQA